MARVRHSGSIVLVAAQSLSLLSLTRAAAADDHELRDGPPIQSIALTAGAVHYTHRDPALIRFPGAADRPGAFVTNGFWTGVDAQVGVTQGFALWGRARFGALRHGPPSTPRKPLRDENVDPSTLDPQLGDRPVGGSWALIARFLPGHVALDAGLTVAYGSFRPRGAGSVVPYRYDCGDCANGMLGHSASGVVPTARISLTGAGPFFSVGTGEGFLIAWEPTDLEAVLGYRGESVEVAVGAAHGLGFRLDVAIGGGFWMTTTVHLTSPESSQPDAFFAGALTLGRRTSSFAPF